MSDGDKDGRYISLILEAAHSIFILVNMYGFNSQTEIFFSSIDWKTFTALTIQIPKVFYPFWG